MPAARGARDRPTLAGERVVRVPDEEHGPSIWRTTLARYSASWARPRSGLAGASTGRPLERSSRDWDPERGIGKSAVHEDDGGSVGGVRHGATVSRAALA